MFNQEVVDYIKGGLNRGNSADNIVNELLGAGWSEEVINASFAQIKILPTNEAQATNSESKLSPIREFSSFIYLAIAFILIDYLIFESLYLSWPIVFIIIGYIIYSRRKRALSGIAPKNRLSDKNRKIITILLFIFVAGIFTYIFSF